MRDQLEASFVAAAATFLYRGDGSSSVTTASFPSADWGGRLPDYTVPDPYSAKAIRRGSRGGTHVDLHRVRDELGEAHEENWGLRRELSAMISRIVQLLTQLVECSGALSRPRKRYREDEENERPENFAIVVIGRRGRAGNLAVTPRRGVGTTLKVTVVAGSRLS